MMNYGSYLVCNEYLDDVRKFLGHFFKEQSDDYTYEGWITFIIPGTDFRVNLMKDNEQAITQNMTFEIYCNSLEKLSTLAEQHKVKVSNFLSTHSSKHYKYHYAEIFGPHNICKIEINYTENVD